MLISVIWSAFKKISIELFSCAAAFSILIYSGLPGRPSVCRDTLPTARSVMMMIMRMMRMAEVMIMMMINLLAMQ